MLRDIWTVFWRDWIVLKRRIGHFILARMITPILYLVAFGWGVGRSVQVGSGNYMDFIVPGVLALYSMNISFTSVATPLNMGRLYHKTLEEYIVAPISAVSFVSGKVLAGVVRGMISSAIIMGLVLLFGVKCHVTLWFVVALGLNCLIFSSLAIVAAMKVSSHEEMANFSTFVLVPMSFLCATFFSPTNLPHIVKMIIEILPLTHASYALRSIALTGEVPMGSIGVLLIYVLIFYILGVLAVRKARD